MSCVLQLSIFICSFVAILKLSVATNVANDRENAIDNMAEVKAYVSAMELRLSIVERKIEDTETELDRQRQINERQEIKIKSQNDLIRTLVEARDPDVLDQAVVLDAETDVTADAGVETAGYTHVFGALDNVRKSRRHSSDRPTSRNEPVRGAVSGKGIVRQVSQHVAFSAWLTHEIGNLGPQQTIVFDGVLLNDGNAYNRFTGIFSTPVTGVYLLTFACEDYHDHRTYTNIVVDGKVIAHLIEASTGHGLHAMASNTVIVRLTIGQAVWVATAPQEYGDYFQYDATTFSGVLLYTN